jgi:hypothetical protein
MSSSQPVIAARGRASRTNLGGPGQCPHLAVLVWRQPHDHSDRLAVWIRGARTFPDCPKALGDVDISVIVVHVAAAERRKSQWCHDPTSRPRRLSEARDAISTRHSVELSPSYLLADEIAAREPPFAFTPRLHHVGWPLERTHFLAGQYVQLRWPQIASPQ